MRKFYIASVLLFAQFGFCQSKEFKSYKFKTSIPTNFSPMREVELVSKSAALIESIAEARAKLKAAQAVQVAADAAALAAPADAAALLEATKANAATAQAQSIVAKAVLAQAQAEAAKVDGKDEEIEKFKNKVKIISGSKVTVIGYSKDSSNVYFEYWDYSDLDSDEAKLYNTPPFAMARNDFNNLTQPLYDEYKGASVGVYTVPFRLRGSGKGSTDFDFESSLSLTANLIFGFGFDTDDFSMADVSVGIGLTSVNLNTSNSKVTEERTASALTISTGLLLKPAKFVNFGIFVGWDTLNANDKSVNWVYNGKTWIGLGINVSFNEIITTNPKNVGSN